jgi:hypothetical protein
LSKYETATVGAGRAAAGAAARSDERTRAAAAIRAILACLDREVDARMIDV